MACIPGDLGEMHLYVHRISLNPIHGRLDVEILERYTDYTKARNEVTYIYIIRF